MANTRWLISRPKHGSHIVRARAERYGGTVIGKITPFRKAGHDVQYMATRADGDVRDFNRRFDAAAWLMDGFDAEQEAL